MTLITQAKAPIRWERGGDGDSVARHEDMFLIIQHVDEDDLWVGSEDIEGVGPWLAEVFEGPFFDEEESYSELRWQKFFQTAKEARRWCLDVASNEALRCIPGMHF